MKKIISRRGFLTTTIKLGATTAVALVSLKRSLFAMGRKNYPQGMQKIQGDVRINGSPAAIGATVQTGDVVTTGAGAVAIFVVVRDVYMLREKTRLELGNDASDKRKLSTINVLKLVNGKMMGVFRNSPKRLEMTTAVAGVRGTGLYAEVEPDRSYLCICYGKAELSSNAAPGETLTIKSRYHDMPRYIYAHGDHRKNITIPGEEAHNNHNDKELILLESYVGRTPPFAEETPHDVANDRLY